MEANLAVKVSLSPIRDTNQVHRLEFKNFLRLHVKKESRMMKTWNSNLEKVRG
jgi:hypothetical protein